MESLNLDSPKEKGKFDIKAHSPSFLMLDEILYWTAHGRVTRYKGKGRTYKGIDGGYVDRAVLKSQSKGHITCDQACFFF